MHAPSNYPLAHFHLLRYRESPLEAAHYSVRMGPWLTLRRQKSSSSPGLGFPMLHPVAAIEANERSGSGPRVVEQSSCTLTQQRLRSETKSRFFLSAGARSTPERTSPTVARFWPHLFPDKDSEGCGPYRDKFMQTLDLCGVNVIGIVSDQPIISSDDAPCCPASRQASEWFACHAISSKVLLVAADLGFHAAGTVTTTLFALSMSPSGYQRFCLHSCGTAGGKDNNCSLPGRVR